MNKENKNQQNLEWPENASIHQITKKTQHVSLFQF